MVRNRIAVVFLLVAGAHSALARADLLDISASTASKFVSTGQHNHPFDTNYLAGTIASSGTHHNYFIFDLAAIPANHDVIAAELFLEMPLGGYLSPDASETYTLFDVTTPIAQLQQSYSAGDATGQAIFVDLGAGTPLGSTSVSEADEQTQVAFALSAAGLAWINQAGAGLVTIGGALTSLSHGPDEYEFAFGFTGDNSVRFLRVTTVEVPEPASLFIASMAACVLGACRIAGRRSRLRS
ncbi:MAG: hypothetical protein WD845_03680 [Pirellulales bacterium]